MEKKKTKSWKYQKDRYKQVSLKFNMDDVDDALLYHYLTRSDNVSKLLKDLIRASMWESAYRNEWFKIIYNKKDFWNEWIRS